jgi:hypothetical protein
VEVPDRLGRGGPAGDLGNGGEQYVAVASGWGGAVPLWGGDVAKKVNFLEQGGSMWVFKLMWVGPVSLES